VFARSRSSTSTTPAPVFVAGSPCDPSPPMAIRRGKTPGLSVHFNGSVALAFALGGHKIGRDSHLPNWQFDSAVVEAAVADFMGLVLSSGIARRFGRVRGPNRNRARWTRAN